MNARSIKKVLLGSFKTSFDVTGERSNNLRFFTVRCPVWLEPQAAEIKKVVLDTITARGYGGGCDIVQDDVFGKKIV